MSLGLILGRGKKFFALPKCPCGLWARSVSYSLCTGGSFPMASSVTSTLSHAFMEWWLLNEMFLTPPWDRKDFCNLFCRVRLNIFVIFEVDCISEAFVTVVGGLL